jgi:hypothetical protein
MKEGQSIALHSVSEFVSESAEESAAFSPSGVSPKSARSSRRIKNLFIMSRSFSSGISPRSTDRADEYRRIEAANLHQAELL